ncbi:hypothetical protein V6N13_030146 [Hibiscus sabdariffa]
MLQKYRSDPSHVMPVEEIELNPDFSYDEEPIEILASDSKVLRGRSIKLVKVKWRHRGVEEATWERKEDMMEQFPYLFPSGETGLGGPNEVLEAPGSSILCISGLEYRNQHGGIGTRFLSGIRVSVLPYGYRYGSRVV